MKNVPADRKPLWPLPERRSLFQSLINWFLKNLFRRGTLEGRCFSLNFHLPAESRPINSAKT
jgi:hypothetical protein